MSRQTHGHERLQCTDEVVSRISIGFTAAPRPFASLECVSRCFVLAGSSAVHAGCCVVPRESDLLFSAARRKGTIDRPPYLQLISSGKKEEARFVRACSESGAHQ